MSVIINVRRLEDSELDLAGEVPVAQLDLGSVDEMAQISKPVRYDLHAQKMGDQILVRGRVNVTFDCECVRCLKRFENPVEFPEWTCLLPLEGEEKIVVTNDCVDLTPYLREDILLEFPQHPLCESDCAGLPNASDVTAKKPGVSQAQNASAWSELNKLKF